MPITVGSLQVFDLPGAGSPPHDVTVDVGSAGTVRVLYVGACGRPGYPYATVLDPGGADEIVGTLHAEDHSSVRGSGVLSVLIPSWLSGTYTLRTSIGTDFADDIRIWARVLNGTAYTPVSSYAMADPTYPFTPVLPLGTLSAGDLVIANANTAVSTDAGFGDWSASTETLTETSSVSYNGTHWYSDGILNGVAGGSFTVSMTGDQVGSAAAIAYTLRGTITMSATANLTEDDDSVVTVSEIVATYLGMTEGETYPATVVTQSVDIGAADPTRQIVGFIAMQDPGCQPTGGTFAGVTATVDIQQSGSGGGWNSGIVRASVPSGSGTQTLSITVTPYTAWHHVDWYSIVGASSDLVDLAGTNDVGSATADVDGVAGGLVFAGHNGIADAASLVDFDFAHVDAFDNIDCSSGYDAVTADGTVNVADNAGGSGFSLVAISLAPIIASATADIVPPMRAIAFLTEDDDTTATSLPIVASYLGTTKGTTPSGPTTITPSVDIGAAAATRQIIAIVHQMYPSGTPTGTFAGVTASADIGAVPGGGQRQVDILRALVPTGSGSQTMSVTLAWTQYVVDWYSVTGAITASVDVGSDIINNPLSVGVDGIEGGIVFGGHIGSQSGDYPWSMGLDFQHQDSQEVEISTVSGYEAVTVTGPVTITDNAAGGGSAMVLLSLAPYSQVATAEIVEGDPPPEPEPGPGGGATPYWGPPQKEKKRPSRASGGGAAGGGSIPKKQLKRAVRELLELEAGKAPGERTSADLAETVVEKLAPKGLAAPYRKPVVDFAREQLEKRLADYFASETKYDNEKLRLALLFILGETLERLRLAEEEEDDEEAVALLLMSVS